MPHGGKKSPNSTSPSKIRPRYKKNPITFQHTKHQYRYHINTSRSMNIIKKFCQKKDKLPKDFKYKPTTTPWQAQPHQLSGFLWCGPASNWPSPKAMLDGGLTSFTYRSGTHVFSRRISAFAGVKNEVQSVKEIDRVSIARVAGSKAS